MVAVTKDKSRIWIPIQWDPKKRRRYQRMLLTLAGIFFLLMLAAGYVALRNSIPDEIQITEDHQKEMREVFANPLITWEDSIPTSGSRQYVISCKVLNTVFLKDVKVRVVDPQWLSVSGEAVGIYMSTDGILIVDTEAIKGEDGILYDPAENLVRPGDYITAFNSIPISSKQDLVREVKGCQGEGITLSLLREGEEINLSINPVKCGEEDYKLGIWVRDDTQGIGTLTYVDSAQAFGALGHGISDVDTGNLLNIEDGQLYETEILGIHKGSKGIPGELSGLIRYQADKVLGTIKGNTENGIYGHLTDTSRLNLRKMEVGHKQEMELGAASILCAVDGPVEEYQVEITQIDMNHQDSNKSFVVKVTDPRLLAKTGGIVQGMSGSPVIQKNKIVGAVTHVFVQDSTSGYGIFIENMLANTK